MKRNVLGIFHYNSHVLGANIILSVRNMLFSNVSLDVDRLLLLFCLVTSALRNNLTVVVHKNTNTNNNDDHKIV